MLLFTFYGTFPYRKFHSFLTHYCASFLGHKLRTCTTASHPATLHVHRFVIFLAKIALIVVDLLGNTAHTSFFDNYSFFDVLLTVQLSKFILVINELDAQNLFYNKFTSCLYMF